jgi:AraC family transcriptional regulator of adaptative response / DNA-3-methyladenine glycosylase II
MDDEHCYRVATSRDGRFDGAFVIAVTSTHIYCRPSCPAMTPKRINVRFYPTPAAAQDAGFRACKRCRPDAAPGSPEWDSRADLVARAVRMIGDGLVEREGIAGLARRLGYSSRQLHRLVFAELGTGPLRLALAHRVQTARTLLETTDMSVSDVAWASGFGSIRQFNDRIREVFALSPTELRAQARRHDRGDRRNFTGSGTIAARLAYRPPLDLEATLDFLGRRAVPGVETYDGTTYRRVLRLPRRSGVVSISSAEHDRVHRVVTCHLRLDDVRDYATAVSRVRRLLDLDADPGAVTAMLGRDPLLGALVATRPGLRVPGTVDGTETAIRAVLGQQISVAGARTLTGRLVKMFGAARTEHPDGPEYCFPTSADLAGASPADLPIPASRGRAVIGLARAVEEGAVSFDPGADRDQTEARLLALPGIGPWTASYIRMRALGDPDVLLDTDLVVRRVLQAPVAAGLADTWKPWRSYATMHLWSSAHSDRDQKATTP